ncbi:hypothetical protein MRX96_006598 [Rhipicephalus microplus]
MTLRISTPTERERMGQPGLRKRKRQPVPGHKNGDSRFPAAGSSRRSWPLSPAPQFRAIGDASGRRQHSCIDKALRELGRKALRLLTCSPQGNRSACSDSELSDSTVKRPQMAAHLSMLCAGVDSARGRGVSCMSGFRAISDGIAAARCFPEQLEPADRQTGPQ